MDIETYKKESLRATALSDTGVAYASLGEVEKALECYKKALTIHREIGDIRNVGVTLGNIGVLFTDVGDYDSSLKFNLKALEIHREVNNRIFEGRTLGNIGYALQNLDRTAEAISILENALEISREVNDKDFRGTTLTNLAGAYSDAREIMDPNLALQKQKNSLIEAVQVCRETGDRVFEAVAIQDLGSYYWANHDNEQALDYYKLALQIHEETENIKGRGNTIGLIGRIRIEVGEREEGIEMVKEALSIAIATQGKHYEEFWRNYLDDVS